MNALATQEAIFDIDRARDLATDAREAGRSPRVHPNGFIQLDLGHVGEQWEKQAGHSGADVRLHIWNPPRVDLPHQDTVNEIHDHVFDMRSTVVRGVLIQRLYEYVVGGVALSINSPRDLAEGDPLPVTHEAYMAVYDKKSSSRLAPSGVKGFLRQVADIPVVQGRSYTQPAFTLHDSVPEGVVVTVMEKTVVHEGNPVVICPVDQPPDNDFDRATAASQDLLWGAIMGSLA